MKLLLGGLMAALAVLLLAPAVEAAQRYAAPAGTGTECTPGNPCSLKEALGGAKANDEVIVTGGAYTPPTPITLSSEATGAFVHGSFSGPPPTIIGSMPQYTLGISASKSRVAYLEVASTAAASAALICASDTVAERMRVSGKGTKSFGAQVTGSCVFRDSLARADGESSAAVFAPGESTTSPGIVRNVTAIGTGKGSAGLRATTFGVTADSSHHVSVKNSILSGESVDLLAVPGAAGTAVAEIAYSNFDSSKAEPETTITEGPGNQTAPPAFVDAAGGDYREAAGSPTIDAGVIDQLGAQDLAGSPRVLGAAPDIGAFEFVPPPTTTSTRQPALVGKLESLSVAPRKFRVLKSGAAIASAKKAPRGATVTYRLNLSATVEFRIERKSSGRKVKGKCVRKTRANRSSKPCPLLKPVKGAFSHLGAAGENRFTFSGRVGGKALKPGSYRLLGSAGGATLNGPFRVVE